MRHKLLFLGFIFNSLYLISSSQNSKPLFFIQSNKVISQCLVQKIKNHQKKNDSEIVKKTVEGKKVTKLLCKLGYDPKQLSGVYFLRYGKSALFIQEMAD